MSTVRVRPGTLPKLLWVNDLREFLYYAGIGVLPRFWARKCLKNNANSENSRKIAAKISAGYVKIYNFEMFTKWYNILTKNMPILCGIYQILALSAEYRLFFCSSNWHFEYLPYNSNWYFEKQLFLSELSIYYNRNHILSSKVWFFTHFSSIERDREILRIWQELFTWWWSKRLRLGLWLLRFCPWGA